MYDSVKNYHEALEEAGIKHVYYESPGTSHEWLTWRRCLHEFAPLLFVNAPTADRVGRPQRQPIVLISTVRQTVPINLQTGRSSLRREAPWAGLSPASRWGRR